MLVAFDGVFMQDYQTGISRLWRAVLLEWCKAGRQEQIVVLDRGGNPVPPWTMLRSVRCERCRYEDPTVAQRNGDLCRSLGVTTYVSSYYTRAEQIPTVMVVYDCIPEVLGWDLRQPPWPAKKKCVEAAQAYVCISENTLVDMRRCYDPLLYGRPVVFAWPGVDKSVFYPPTAFEDAEFRKRYGLGTEPYVVCSSPGSGYKNVKLLYEAMELAGWPYLVVGTSPGGSRLPSHEGKVLHLRLTDDELRAAYGGALALAYPSLYEGFGLPVIEAMACGCPVITTERGSLPEAGGELATYISGESPLELANALATINNQGQVLRETRSRLMVKWAKRFEWRALADAIWRSLEEVSK